MGKEVTIGGNRLGSGKKMKAYTRSYERSTHDLGYIWRSTMATGTLVPFMNLVGLPGDTFDIELGADVKTHPTIAPLFGSFKLQLDVFTCPMRLYIGKLHNNKLGVGMDMSKVKLPLIQVEAPNANPRIEIPMDIQQINPSSLLSYLGIRGLGKMDLGTSRVKRNFNAIPYLGYWDIYKNYYANKQEEIGAFINTELDNPLVWTAERDNEVYDTDNEMTAQWGGNPAEQVLDAIIDPNYSFLFYVENYTPYSIEIMVDGVWYDLEQYWTTTYSSAENKLYGIHDGPGFVMQQVRTKNRNPFGDNIPAVQTFKLENIDDMREKLLDATSQAQAVILSKNDKAPYGTNLGASTGGNYPSLTPMQGLALKTYQSDIFNNWIQSEWIDGENGIAALTAIDTSEGNFTLDTLNLAEKVYNMLNQISLSGGTYEDWVSVVYDHEPYRRAESPIYMGGLSKEIVFQEVVSTAKTDEDNPLGTLGGKGVMAKKHKGGRVTIKVDEPSVIIGIVSITPRIDYSQGNDWAVNLKTMDDLHKPALDQIGYQALLSDLMAFWDTDLDVSGTPTFKEVGKQPAWLNYMTNFNKCYGNFADSRNQMFMTLNRRYEYDGDGNLVDATTYIDPIKFNDVFAQKSLDAQNFWTQIALDITARRKMSAKQIPNL